MIILMSRPLGMVDEGFSIFNTGILQFLFMFPPVTLKEPFIIRAVITFITVPHHILMDFCVFS